MSSANDVPQPATHSPPPATNSTSSAAAPPAGVIRRGRGTFSHRLRTEDHERQANRDRSEITSILTGAATTVVLPTPAVVRPPDEARGEAEVLARAKKNIPLHSTRECFGTFNKEEGQSTTEADTVRQLLFRGDKRRRYCVIVDDLQDSSREVNLKLFGHRGPKPYKLQNKIIRLIHLSATRAGVTNDSGDTADVTADAAANNNAREEEVVPKTEATPEVTEAKANSQGAIENSTSGAEAAAAAAADPSALDGDVDGDVDRYLENCDEVVPLTVQSADGPPGAQDEINTATSPVLTARRFSSLQDYFHRELTFLLGLEDVRAQYVSVQVNLGAAYCCLGRQGSQSVPLKYATFSELVEQLNDETMQLYFINDCPPCVSRAVDMECGALHHEASLTMVKIIFFSNERQSRSIARAVWDSKENAFRLLDMENTGVSFNWTVFSLDEGDDAPGSSPHANTTTSGGAASRSVGRHKTVAYPFELEFRAFRRWRQHGDHPAAPLAEAILEKLSLAEQNRQNFGSSIGYEGIDLSHVCEVDYASEDFNVESIIVEHTARGRPVGTDLLVDNTTYFLIENFAAARQLVEKVAQHGPARVAALQTATNNNYMRSRGGRGRQGGRGGATAETAVHAQVIRPTSKLTFFRSRGSSIHWKFRLGCSVEANLSPLAEALRFVQQVLRTANSIEQTSLRGGAAPEAL